MNLLNIFMEESGEEVGDRKLSRVLNSNHFVNK